MPPVAPVRPPLQERSRRTLERILRATERLLKKRPFEEIGVQQIVRAARTSVGAFYTRFEEKGALLPALYERYEEGLDDHVAGWRDENGAAPQTLFGAAAWVTDYLIDSFRRRRHLLRALALHVRQHPGEVDQERADRRARQHRFLEEALLAHADVIPDVDPERAVRAAVFVAASTVRERILFDDSAHARRVPSDDDALAADVARTIVGYLLCPLPPRSR